MAETKNEAFHRLAAKRVEGIEDALRVFSNLSGPSYEFTEPEARTYLGRIEAGLATATARFAEARKWPAPAPAAIPDMAPTTLTDRERTMLAVWAEADNETGALIEMLAMQREVIAGLQRRLDQR